MSFLHAQDKRMDDKEKPQSNVHVERQDVRTNISRMIDPKYLQKLVTILVVLLRHVRDLIYIYTIYM